MARTRPDLRAENNLFYGDNLEVLRENVPDGVVDLAYLDPPFNSKKEYNIYIQTDSGLQSKSQIKAFEDFWIWDERTEETYKSIASDGVVPGHISETVHNLVKILGKSDTAAYLVMMAPRLFEIYRTLTPTGSMVLHCDPTASHYIKILLDSIFKPRTLVNEIIWFYDNGGGRSKSYFSKKHDVLFWYAKGPNFVFNADEVRIPYKETSGYAKSGGITAASGKRYSTNKKGKVPEDVWEIPILNPMSKERLGYPTQKPLRLLERVVTALSNPEDLVMDPFCGCGTTIDAAESLGRRWAGVDISFLAVNLQIKRLTDRYQDRLTDFSIRGIPETAPAARALFDSNPLDFERWAVTRAGGEPNDKQTGDRGIDGIIRFFETYDGKSEFPDGRVVISVKGGKNVNPAMVRELHGTVEREKAAIGVLITNELPSKSMKEHAAQAGFYENVARGHSYPKIQLVTVDDLLGGTSIKMPEAVSSFKTADTLFQNNQERLFS